MAFAGLFDSNQVEYDDESPEESSHGLWGLGGIFSIGLIVLAVVGVKSFLSPSRSAAPVTPEPLSAPLVAGAGEDTSRAAFPAPDQLLPIKVALAGKVTTDKGQYIFQTLLQTTILWNWHRYGKDIWVR